MSDQRQNPVSSEVPQQSSPSGDTIFNEVYDLAPYEKTMKNARVWLYVIAAIQFAMGIYEYYSTPERTVGIIAFGIDAAVAIAFLGLALWSRKNPVPAFTTALIIYLVFNIGFMILDTSNIYRGIILKIFATIALVKANIDARKYEEMRASLGKSG